MKIVRKKDDVDGVVTESDFTMSLSANRYTHFVCIYCVSLSNVNEKVILVLVNYDNSGLEVYIVYCKRI